MSKSDRIAPESILLISESAFIPQSSNSAPSDDSDQVSSSSWSSQIEQFDATQLLDRITHRVLSQLVIATSSSSSSSNTTSFSSTQSNEKERDKTTTITNAAGGGNDGKNKESELMAELMHILEANFGRVGQIESELLAKQKSLLSNSAFLKLGGQVSGSAAGSGTSSPNCGGIIDEYEQRVEVMNLSFKRLEETLTKIGTATVQIGSELERIDRLKQRARWARKLVDRVRLLNEIDPRIVKEYAEVKFKELKEKLLANFAKKKNKKRNRASKMALSRTKSARQKEEKNPAKGVAKAKIVVLDRMFYFDTLSNFRSTDDSVGQDDDGDNEDDDDEKEEGGDDDENPDELDDEQQEQEEEMMLFVIVENQIRLTEELVEAVADLEKVPSCKRAVENIVTFRNCLDNFMITYFDDLLQQLLQRQQQLQQQQQQQQNEKSNSANARTTSSSLRPGGGQLQQKRRDGKDKGSEMKGGSKNGNRAKDEMRRVVDKLAKFVQLASLYFSSNSSSSSQPSAPVKSSRNSGRIANGLENSTPSSTSAAPAAPSKSNAPSSTSRTGFNNAVIMMEKLESLYITRKLFSLISISPSSDTNLANTTSSSSEKGSLRTVDLNSVHNVQDFRQVCERVLEPAVANEILLAFLVFGLPLNFGISSSSSSSATSHSNVPSGSTVGTSSRSCGYLSADRMTEKLICRIFEELSGTNFTAAHNNPTTSSSSLMPNANELSNVKAGAVPMDVTTVGSSGRTEDLSSLERFVQSHEQLHNVVEQWFRNLIEKRLRSKLLLFVGSSAPTATTTATTTASSKLQRTRGGSTESDGDNANTILVELFVEKFFSSPQQQQQQQQLADFMDKLEWFLSVQVKQLQVERQIFFSSESFWSERSGASRLGGDNTGTTSALSVGTGGGGEVFGASSGGFGSKMKEWVGLALGQIVTNEKEQMKNRKKSPDRLLALVEPNKSGNTATSALAMASSQLETDSTTMMMMNIFPRLETIVEMIYVVENAIKMTKKLFFQSVQHSREEMSVEDGEQQIEVENMRSLSRFGLSLWEILVRNVENYLKESIDLGTDLVSQSQSVLSLHSSQLISLLMNCPSTSMAGLTQHHNSLLASALNLDLFFILQCINIALVNLSSKNVIAPSSSSSAAAAAASASAAAMESSSILSSSNLLNSSNLQWSQLLLSELIHSLEVRLGRALELQLKYLLDYLRLILEWSRAPSNPWDGRNMFLQNTSYSTLSSASTPASSSTTGGGGGSSQQSQGGATSVQFGSGDVTTLGCRRIVELLNSRIIPAIQSALFGRNREEFMVEFGLSFFKLLVAHLRQLQVSPNGAIRLMSDCTCFRDTLRRLDSPLVDEKFDFLRDIANTFFFPASSLQNVLVEMNLLQRSGGNREELLAFLKMRVDFKKEKIGKFPIFTAVVDQQ